ncbi:hydroxymethylglutaryl-CoA lyase [Oceanomicrobium pacificus]|uniref:Hydroxymethylglutaryl-CoA lyase n=1 Tax=Oceanomicrobium pacificus TaxID=2692916 RepID=A0A6B0TRA7_9RHOB|nr:hydroxymethylglutaryl-CoA lyase [Oceanomicrobium pacificus]MXU63894.1 hydroxymethylglutaryl-CoA lyase [Oceanomicrobium pacificus]
MAERVTIYEMAPRDGLQNEKAMIATPDKVRLVDLLSQAGFARIEVTSFVSPKWVPQLADAAEVMGAIARRPGTAYAALAPNMRGYIAARDAGADEVAVFAAASESFSRKNINCSIAESFERFAPILDAAAQDGITVRGYVSCVTDCPFEGEIAPEAVARVAVALMEAGCREVSLGDTLGRGTPERVDAMLQAVLRDVPADRLAGHFHDTSGRAVENVGVALDHGLRVFDSAAGGLGGCPYAPGAAGNLATETLDSYLRDRGFDTGLDRAALDRAATFARSLRKDLP